MPVLGKVHQHHRHKLKRDKAHAIIMMLPLSPLQYCGSDSELTNRYSSAVGADSNIVSSSDLYIRIN